MFNVSAITAKPVSKDIGNIKCTDICEASMLDTFAEVHDTRSINQICYDALLEMLDAKNESLKSYFKSMITEEATVLVTEAEAKSAGMINRVKTLCGKIKTAIVKALTALSQKMSGVAGKLFTNGETTNISEFKNDVKALTMNTDDATKKAEFEKLKQMAVSMNASNAANVVNAFDLTGELDEIAKSVKSYKYMDGFASEYTSTNTSDAFGAVFSAFGANAAVSKFGSMAKVCSSVLGAEVKNMTLTDIIHKYGLTNTDKSESYNPKMMTDFATAFLAYSNSDGGSRATDAAFSAVEESGLSGIELVKGILTNFTKPDESNVSENDNWKSNILSYLFNVGKRWKAIDASINKAIASVKAIDPSTELTRILSKRGVTSNSGAPSSSNEALSQLEFEVVQKCEVMIHTAGEAIVNYYSGALKVEEARLSTAWAFFNAVGARCKAKLNELAKEV